MQAIDPLIQTMTDRNTAHNEVIRLRAILESFKENLECYLVITRRSLDTQLEMHNQGHRGGTRAVEDLAQIKAIEHLRDCLYRLERSTR
jgi:hypothetical protein